MPTSSTCQMPPLPGSLPRLTAQGFGYAGPFSCGLDPRLPPAAALMGPEGGSHSASPLLLRGPSSGQPDTQERHSANTGQISLRALHPTTQGPFLSHPWHWQAEGAQALPFEQDCRPRPPNSTQSNPLSPFCGELVKNNHDNHHFHRASRGIYKTVPRLSASSLSPGHQLIPLARGSPAPAVPLVCHSAPEPQGRRGRGRWLLELPGSTSAVQYNWASL